MVQFELSTPRERLLHIRRLFKLTQKDLSILLDASTVTISNWENKTPNLNIKAFRNLINLGINPNYIINGDCITYYHFTIEDIIKNIDKTLTIKRDK